MYYKTISEPEVKVVNQPEDFSEFNRLHRSFYSRSQPALVNNMEPKAKSEWISALRSGKYKQGNNSLQTEGGANCCLGVKCVVDGLTFELIESVVNPRSMFIFPNGSGSNTWLSSEYADSQGMIDGQGTFYYEVTFFGTKFWIRESLGNLNDDDFTFDQIADVIECFF